MNCGCVLCLIVLVGFYFAFYDLFALFGCCCVVCYSLLIWFLVTVLWCLGFIGSCRLLSWGIWCLSLGLVICDAVGVSAICYCSVGFGWGVLLVATAFSLVVGFILLFLRLLLVD